MKKAFSLLLLICALSSIGYSQKQPLSPQNIPADIKIGGEEKYVMKWYMLRDTVKVQIGSVETNITKSNKKIHIVTKVDMRGASSQWIDSTVVNDEKFEPLYHSSINQQREMELNFDEMVTGYYFDKKSGTKSKITEEVNKSFFDSNFYPQLIRWLPLSEGYSTAISIFDYNPNSNIGVLTATLKNTEKSSIDINGDKRSVWKIKVTDDISDNTVLSTYFIERGTRKLLRQEINFGNRQMLMEISE